MLLAGDRRGLAEWVNCTPALGLQCEGGRELLIHRTAHYQPNVGRQDIGQSCDSIPDLLARTGQHVDPDQTSPREHRAANANGNEAAQLDQW